MPEGPSLYLLKELVKDFSGQEIVRAGGNVRAIDPERLVGQRIDPRCDIPLLKANLGRSNRRSFYCENCQKRYN